MLEYAELLAECAVDPGFFHELILGRHPLHPTQERIARSVLENRVTVVPAAHAVGKSWYAATAILHWLYTRRGAKVITTSASNTQLVSVLWSAVKAAHAQSRVKLPGRISVGHAIPQRIDVQPDWFALGWSANQPESFSGFHGDDLLVVVDEASGVQQPIWDAIESMGYTSLLALGNPLRATGHFRSLWDAAQTGSPGYAGFHLSAFDSPYATLTDQDVRAQGLPIGLVTKTWIDGVRRLYGEGSLYWLTRVLARFPDEDTDALLPGWWVDRCADLGVVATCERLRAEGRGGPRYLSLDLAVGSGRDRTVILVRDNVGVLDLIESADVGLAQAADLAARKAREWAIQEDCLIFDAGGLGRDFPPYLEQYGIEGYPYHGGASGGPRFANRRTRASWWMRQRFDPTRPLEKQPDPVDDGDPWKAPPQPASTQIQPPFAIPARFLSAEFREELTGLRYELATGGKIALEKKEDWMDRLGRSPDMADALTMSFALSAD